LPDIAYLRKIKKPVQWGTVQARVDLLTSAGKLAFWADTASECRFPAKQYLSTASWKTALFLVSAQNPIICLPPLESRHPAPIRRLSATNAGRR